MRIQNVDPDIAEALGLASAKGALVTDVPEGPALEAGLRAGDVILSFGGEPIDDTRELVRLVAESEVGRSVDVVVFRERRRDDAEGRDRPAGGDDACRRARVAAGLPLRPRARKPCSA